MPPLSSMAWLERANLVLASANVLVSFSLIVYLLVHNSRHAVARSFCALLALATLVYVGDVFLAGADSPEGALFWQRFQWLGLAFVPAAYLHFSDALLGMTNARSVWRRRSVFAAYGVGALFLALAGTGWLAPIGADEAGLGRPTTPSLFGVYASYFCALIGWSLINIYRARLRCLNGVTRRRMTYLGIGVMAPCLGVFPYLMLTGTPSGSTPLLLLVTVVGNLGVALMTMLAGYSVAYQGALLPDRVVKRKLVEYLVQVPLLGTSTIAVILLLSSERPDGLAREIIPIFSIILGLTVYQVAVIVFKPLAYRAIYREENDEVSWMRQLDEHLLTGVELNELMENIVTAVCDLLRVQIGFAAAFEDRKLRLLASCGGREAPQHLIQTCDPASLSFEAQPNPDASSAEMAGIRWDGFWLFPLSAPEGGLLLGILGVSAHAAPAARTTPEYDVVMDLIDRAGRALGERRAQESIFAMLRQMTNGTEALERWEGIPRYVDSLSAQAPAVDLLSSPEFVSWVKAALSHYWGGPKLSQNPLVRLRIVQHALKETDPNLTKALRTVLNQAIESFKPAGNRSWTASEWLLYNILELRFVERLAVCEVAPRLCISQSDLYRKQRIAIEAVARQVAYMEEGLARESHATTSNPPVVQGLAGEPRPVSS